MRFHIVGLAHTKVVEGGEFESCAFTQKVRKFAKMMAQRGHLPVIYGTEGSGVAGVEIVECLREEERAEIMGQAHYTRASWEHPKGQKFLANVIEALRGRLAEGDFICLIGGTAQRAIFDAFGGKWQVVEFGIGYGGSFAPWRVFESRAWQHLTYGAEGGRNPNDAKPGWGDAVIPNYFESEALPAGAGEGQYVAFLGRLNADKGIYVASQVAKALKMPFKYAGVESGLARPEYGDYLGELSGRAKADFLGNAAVVLCPSQYIEPFCGVAVEAQMCGTPVVGSDFGAFGENIAIGRTGFRAMVFEEFVEGTRLAMGLDRRACRDWAMQFDCKAVALRYEGYFKRLERYRQGGWYGQFAAG